MILWFLPAILILGIITSYTDIKEGKIKNKHILFALIYGVIAYSILVFINLGQIRIGYFVELIIMCVLSLVVGFIIWHVGLWTSGDAKLFFAYSLLIPLSVYKYGHILYFSSTNILVNTFVPMFLFLFVLLLFKTSFKQKVLFLKKSFIPKQIMYLAIFLFAFGWLINILFRFAKIPPNYFIMIFALFLLMMLFERITFLSLLQVTIVIGILRFIFDSSIYSLTFLKELLFLVLVFIILRFFVIHMGFYFFTKEMDIKLLKQGMVPAEAVYEEKGKYKKQELIFYSLFGYLIEKTKKRKYLFEPTSEGLTEEAVKKLKKLEKKLGFEHLRIQQTIPFAPFMFFGVLLTIILKGNAFVVIRLLLPF